jgi:hypothetical protein
MLHPAQKSQNLHFRHPNAQKNIGMFGVGLITPHPLHNTSENMGEGACAEGFGCGLYAEGLGMGMSGMGIGGYGLYAEGLGMGLGGMINPFASKAPPSRRPINSHLPEDQPKYGYEPWNTPNGKKKLAGKKLSNLLKENEMSESDEEEVKPKGTGLKKFKKGSAEAKAYMASIRAKRGSKGKGIPSPPSRSPITDPSLLG